MPCYRLMGEMEGEWQKMLSAYLFALITVFMTQFGHGLGMASDAGG